MKHREESSAVAHSQAHIWCTHTSTRTPGGGTIFNTDPHFLPSVQATSFITSNLGIYVTSLEVYCYHHAWAPLNLQCLHQLLWTTFHPHIRARCCDGRTCAHFIVTLYVKACVNRANQVSWFHTTLDWFQARPDLPSEMEMSWNKNLTKSTEVLHWYLEETLVIQKTHINSWWPGVGSNAIGNILIFFLLIK